MSMRRLPTRSARAPVTGAESAEAYVRKPRKRPAANVVPPRSRIRKGAVGSSWNAERKTVNVKPHIMKKRGVNSRSSEPVTSVRGRVSEQAVAVERLRAVLRAHRVLRRLAVRAIEHADPRVAAVASEDVEG